MTRVGLVSDVHWRADAASAGGWHDGGTAPAGWHGTGAELAGALDRLSLALQRFAEHEVDLVALAGDLAHHGEPDALAAVLSACSEASAPVLVVAGNHDVDGDADRLACAHAQAAPLGVELGSPAGAPLGDLHVAGVHVGATAGWFGARLAAPPDTAAWGGEPTLLVSHYPALTHAATVADAGFPYPGDLIDRRELAALLHARAAPTVVVGGHVHARAARAEGAVLQLSGGALVEPPYECTLVDVERSAPALLAVRRTSLRLREPDGPREPVLAPEQESWLFDGMQWRSIEETDDEAQHRADPDDARRQPAAT